MVDYTLRKFDGFNSLSVDCSNCKNICSLSSNSCVDCVNNINKSFSLLELRKKFSTIYFDNNLSVKIKSNLSEFVPLLVPKFLLYYIVPKSFSKVLFEGKFYKIVEENNQRSIIFNPIEYNFDSKELELFNDTLIKVQNEELNISDLPSLVPELSPKIIKLISSYTKGLGFIDDVLGIKEIQDVFINSPGSSCVFFSHSKFGSLSSNLFLKNEMLNRISTYLRTNSSRPFDESYPAIHSNIESYNTRICGVSYPLTQGGIGFALRKHSINPISVPELVSSKFLSSKVAGLLWFLIDADIKILITGPRGSGKTTLLNSLLFLVNKNNRMIVIEDTKELAVPHLRNNGFNIEHLRTNSFDNLDSFEFSNDTALRTALRLGESLLVLGEVRGTEAKFLFEAMRIGASGNNVLGTIHGSSAFDTFDRVVNDLGVPPSSFKAADVVISCSYFEDKKSKVRRLCDITEIKKDWINNPLKEKGFFDIVTFNPRTKKYKFNLESSSLIKKIAYKKGISIKKCLNEILLRQKIIDSILKYSKDLDNSYLTSCDFVCKVINNNSFNFDYDKIKSFVKSFSIKNDIDLILTSALKDLRALSKKSAVSSKDLYLKVSNKMSRIKFNSLLNKLENNKLIKSFVKEEKRYWFLSK